MTVPSPGRAGALGPVLWSADPRARFYHAILDGTDRTPRCHSLLRPRESGAYPPLQLLPCASCFGFEIAEYRRQDEGDLGAIVGNMLGRGQCSSGQRDEAMRLWREGYTADVIVYSLVYCHRRGKHDVAYFTGVVRNRMHRQRMLPEQRPEPGGS